MKDGVRYIFYGLHFSKSSLSQRVFDTPWCFSSVSPESWIPMLSSRARTNVTVINSRELCPKYKLSLFLVVTVALPFWNADYRTDFKKNTDSYWLSDAMLVLILMVIHGRWRDILGYLSSELVVGLFLSQCQTYYFDFNIFHHLGIPFRCKC